MKKKSWLFAAMAVILLSVVIIIFSGSKSDTTQLTTKVQKGPFEVLVYSSGQLESENSDHVYVPEKMKDRQTRISNLTITDIVEEGTYVDSGDYVATLDHQAVQEQLKDAQDELEKTFSEFNDSKIDSNLTLSNERDLIINAELDVEERKIAVDESVYESPSEQKKVRMDYDKAVRKLEQSKQAYALKTQQEINKVNRKFITYKQVKERVDALEELMDQLIVYSPKAGIISYHQYEWGGTVETGSRVSQWSPIIATFPNMDNLVTKTFINEIDIALIKPGQKVRIGIDAFPDKTLTGEVATVANMGQLMPKSDAKVFEVKIKVDGSDPALKPAMTTSNTIQANYLEDATYVPIEAVFSNDSLSYVYLTDSQTKQIVETGEANENYFVIKQGLEEGQEIQLLEPMDANDYKLSGFEIYAEIKRKAAEQKAKEEAERAKRKQETPQPELPNGMTLPPGVVITGVAG
ncbi:HlyD family efflux transporter periplasmic adaptor subunit [Draconibacterium sp. IB214405]|uniref:efflux RND transporter periplasmic adaptor subunit n=1 Tax=Draconibacterium sp. IB214405 TaxID=3097352 RepID=UPI002A0D918F|nr:efflux RND transporter periplasmic adaptor subunit [Draconibacterium sp. IB214405]MDX8340971.1 HlyD family efflux transporter periplasmic adaptor subunit [Draconibacterium sp. IB214405]